jgi:hypothetical protein
MFVQHNKPSSIFITIRESLAPDCGDPALVCNPAIILTEYRAALGRADEVLDEFISNTKATKSMSSKVADGATPKCSVFRIVACFFPQSDQKHLCGREFATADQHTARAIYLLGHVADHWVSEKLMSQLMLS